jgi:hypothetical protein
MMIEKKETAVTGAATRCVRTAVVLAMGLVGASFAQAGDASPGLRVVKDPVTGELRAPTGEEAAALQSAAPVDARGASVVRRGLATGKINPQRVTHANGMMSLELDESTLSYSVARRNADGTTDWVCVTGPEAAAAALAAKTTSKDAKEHNHVEK